MSKAKYFSAISLFTGAGGMDVGFRKAGIIPILANDIDAAACESYRLNHDSEILHGDVRSFFSRFSALGEVNFVFGGPPCQGFSVAGKMDPSDARNSLIQTFVDVVHLVKPKVFVCENVKALAILKKWESVRELVFKRTLSDYSVGLIILNSKDYGVPQNRERMFFIGVSRKILDLSRDEMETLLFEKLKRYKRKAKTLGAIIKKLGPAGSESNSRVCNAKITYAKKPVLRPSPYAGMLFNGAGRPLQANGHSSTLPASMGGNKTPIIDEGVIFDNKPSFIEAYHAHLMKRGKPRVGKVPKRMRRMTIDECLAVQTFPSDYQLYGGQSAAYRQIGNAVPCDLAEVVAKICVHIVIENDRNKTQEAE